MEFSSFITLVSITFVFAVSPGPGTLAVLATSTRHGFTQGFFLSIGETMGDVFYLLVVLFSLGVLASFLTPVMTYVKYIGAAYLCYLGYKQFTSPALSIEEARVRRAGWKQIIAGLAISGTNPKVIAFYLSFLPLFVKLENISLTVGLQIVATVAVMVLTGLSVVNLVGQQLRRLLGKPQFAKRINQLTGGILMGVGVAVACS